jgi:hypothetical protein
VLIGSGVILSSAVNSSHPSPVESVIWLLSGLILAFPLILTRMLLLLLMNINSATWIVFVGNMQKPSLTITLNSRAASGISSYVDSGDELTLYLNELLFMNVKSTS